MSAADAVMLAFTTAIVAEMLSRLRPPARPWRRWAVGILCAVAFGAGLYGDGRAFLAGGMVAGAVLTMFPEQAWKHAKRS